MLIQSNRVGNDVGFIYGVVENGEVEKSAFLENLPLEIERIFRFHR